jgi:hypothetical protein
MRGGLPALQPCLVSRHRRGSSSHEGGAVMAPQDEAMRGATAEANEVFDRLRNLVEEQVRQGAEEIGVLEVAREAGLELDERTLAELQIPPSIPVLRFLPWFNWFPWCPLWCLWWRRYPWYRCTWWWWHRCHSSGCC